jgi:hypothetical protein
VRSERHLLLAQWQYLKVGRIGIVYTLWKGIAKLGR